MWIGLYIGIWFFILLIIGAIFTVIKFSKKRKLSAEKLSIFQKQANIIARAPTSKERIIDYDKLFHAILKALWYNGTFWEILKQEPNEVYDLQKIWKLHKIRNALVHEFDNHEPAWLEKQAYQYQKHIQYLLKNIT